MHWVDEFELSGEWRDLRADSNDAATQREQLGDELSRELAPAHELAGRSWTVIGRSARTDDVIIELPDSTVAIVHLTWVSSSPDRAPWPSTTFVGSPAELTAELADRAGEPVAQLVLTRIGYWDGPETSPGWPDPKKFVDSDWDEEERATIAAYLQNGLVTRFCMGVSTCRICGIANGNLELTDMAYTWPEGLVHYVTDHGVRLPPMFVEHVERMEATLGESRVDDQWWRGLRDR